MGWEWRYFVPATAAPPKPTGEKERKKDRPQFHGYKLGKAKYRQDIYYANVGGPTIGLKLRKGEGDLEVKQRRDIKPIDVNGVPAGAIENWFKSVFQGCVQLNSSVPKISFQSPQLTRFAFSSTANPTLVRVTKSRRRTEMKDSLVEVTDCEFAVLDSNEDIVDKEFWTSVCAENDDPKVLQNTLNFIGVPGNAQVMGYPHMVDAVVNRSRARRDIH